METVVADASVEVQAAEAHGASAYKPGRYDPMYPLAVRIVRDSGRASISILQRELGINYWRADSLLAAMEGDIVARPGPDGVRPIMECRQRVDGPGESEEPTDAEHAFRRAAELAGLPLGRTRCGAYLCAETARAWDLWQTGWRQGFAHGERVRATSAKAGAARKVESARRQSGDGETVWGAEHDSINSVA